MDTHDIERPEPLSSPSLFQSLTKSLLLHSPSSRFHFHHVHVDDQLICIPCSPSLFIERSALLAFEPSFASMEPSNCGIVSGAGEKKGVGFDRSVNGSFVAIDVYLSSTEEVWGAYRTAEVTGNRLRNMLPPKTVSVCVVSPRWQLTRSTRHSRKIRCPWGTWPSVSPTRQGQVHDQAYRQCLSFSSACKIKVAQVTYTALVSKYTLSRTRLPQALPVDAGPLSMNSLSAGLSRKLARNAESARMSPVCRTALSLDLIRNLSVSTDGTNIPRSIFVPLGPRKVTRRPAEVS